MEVSGYNSVPQTTQHFMALATIFGISDSIIDTCTSLRKKKKIKLPDAIITATALVHGLTLLTRNTNGFQQIEELVCLNPHEL